MKFAGVAFALIVGFGLGWLVKPRQYGFALPESERATLVRTALYDDLPATMSMLVDSGTPVDQVLDDEEGTTLLHGAVDLNSAEVAKLLLDRGADPNRPDSRGLRPIDLVEKDAMWEVFSNLARPASATEGVPDEVIGLLLSRHNGLIQGRTVGTFDEEDLSPAMMNLYRAALPTAEIVGTSSDARKGDMSIDITLKPVPQGQGYLFERSIRTRNVGWSGQQWSGRIEPKYGFWIVTKDEILDP